MYTCSVRTVKYQYVRYALKHTVHDLETFYAEKFMMSLKNIYQLHLYFIYCIPSKKK